MDHRSQEKLHAALLNAFPSWEELDRMVSFHFNQNLSVLAERTNLGQAVFDLIQWADARSDVEGLVRAALRANGENMQLVAIAQSLGIVGRRAPRQWAQCAGPYGGGVMALAVDPHDSRVLYAGTAHSSDQNDWVYKSVDGGGCWKVLRNGWRGDQAYAIAVGFHDRRVVYVGTEHGLFKSTDGGTSWQLESERNAGLEVRSVVLSPQNPDLVMLGSIKRRGGGVRVRTAFAISAQENISGKSVDPRSGGYHTSMDDGRTWVTTAIRNVTSVAISPQDSQVVYLGTENGVFRSLDGGNRLENVGRFGHPVFGLAVSPGDNRHVAVGTERGLFISFDGGQSWKQSYEIGDAEVDDVAFSTADGSRAWAGTSAGVYESRDGGLSWEAMNTGLVPAKVLSLASVEDGTVYAGTDGGGCYKKRFHEVSWQAANSSLFPLPGLTLAVQSDRIIHVGTTAGVLASANEGHTWRNIGPPARTNVWSLVVTSSIVQRPVPNREAGGFHISGDKGRSWEVGGYQDAVSAYYVGTEHGRIMKTADGGLSWESIDLTGRAAIYSLTAVPRDERILYAATRGQGVFRSIDGGTSWHPANSGLDDRVVAVVVVSPQDGQLLYCGTAAHGVYRSSDGGESWQTCGFDLTDKRVVSLAIATEAADVIFAGTEGTGVFGSYDGGASWSEMNLGLQNLNVRSVVVSSQNPTMLFAGTEDGVYVTRNGRDSWQTFNDGLGPHPNVNQLALSPSGKVLFAAMATGVFRVDLD